MSIKIQPTSPDARQTRLLSDIRSSVAALAHRAGITDQRAFAAWYATTFLDIDEDQALEAASVDGGEDQGIDFFCIDDINERVVVLQAHYPEPQNQGKATPKTKVDILPSITSYLAKPSVLKKAGRAELAALAEEMQDKSESHELILGLVSLGASSDQCERSIATFNDDDKYRPVSFFYEHNVGIGDRYEAFLAGHDNVPEGTISFVTDKSWFSDKGQYGNAWVGSVSGAELAGLYKLHGDRLFARNVRLFLGTRKGGINERIVETAKTEPGKFWALNNGVTIVADSIQPLSDGQFKLSRFSIVNGCQTTVSLFRAGSHKDIKVLTRLVAANPLVIGDIVRYNNTQNAIKIWTVRAADKVQERLRASFKKVNVEYAPKPDNTRKKPGSGHVILLDRLAQYLAATRPDTLISAVKEKSELFDRYYQSVFPHSIAAEEVLLTWFIGTESDLARQQRVDQLREQDNLDKTQAGLLGVAGTYWITFCAHRLVSSFNAPPLRLDLKKMVVPEFYAALRKYVGSALDVYLDIAIDTYDEDEFPGVRQALRSPKFFQKLNQKLANRLARMKQTDKKLPSLEHVMKSIK